MPARSPPHILDLEHVLGVSIHMFGGTMLAVVNIHLPPSLGPHNRRQCCVDTAAFFRRQPLGLQLLCGDLNASLDSPVQSWLSHALSPAGIWSGFRCPYPRGVPTNIVRRRGRPSAREIDWVFLGPATPYTSCVRTTHPGLSTHRALVVDIVIPLARFPLADPSGRRFLYRLVPPDVVPAMGIAVSLCVWWAVAACMDANATLLLIWGCMRSFVPMSTRRRTPTSELVIESNLASGPPRVSPK